MQRRTEDGYRLDRFRVEHAVQGVQSVLAEHGVPGAGFNLGGKPVNLSEAVSRLKRTERQSFHIVGHGFDFLFGCVRNFQLGFLKVESTHEPTISWDKWTARFIGTSDFVMAWLANSEYQHWQNAKDLLQYTAFGKSYAGLPMKSNGLPYPLEQQIIDTSANPGRWDFQNGYLEAVGAVMWLGEPFWQLTGADRTQVESTPWLQISKPVPSAIRVQAAEKCFTTAEGKSGELQRKLRLLLFPQTTRVPLER